MQKVVLELTAGGEGPYGQRELQDKDGLLNFGHVRTVAYFSVDLGS